MQQRTDASCVEQTASLTVAAQDPALRLREGCLQEQLYGWLRSRLSPSRSSSWRAGAMRPTVPARLRLTLSTRTS